MWRKGFNKEDCLPRGFMLSLGNFPNRILAKFFLSFLAKKGKNTHTHTWPNKVGLSSESTVNSICTTGHSRGSFLSTLCSPVIRSFLRLTVRWRDGLLAGRTQGPIHSKPQSQSTSGIQKKKEVKDFETWQSPKKILETGNESLSQKLMQEQRNL